ncbi:MAG: hypothetical protein ACHRXM_07925 [Isosphaerales bacterium]
MGGTGVPGASGEVQIPVVAGNTYYIQASGYQGSTGAFHLTVTGQPLKTAALAAKSITLDARGSANLDDAVSVLGGRNSDQVARPPQGR